MKSDHIMVCMRWHLKTWKRYSVQYRAHKGVLAAQLFFKVPRTESYSKDLWLLRCHKGPRFINEKLGKKAQSLQSPKLCWNAFFFIMSMFDVPWNSLHLNLLAISIYCRHQSPGKTEVSSQQATWCCEGCQGPPPSTQWGREGGTCSFSSFSSVQTNGSSLLSKEFKSQEKHFPITTEQNLKFGPEWCRGQEEHMCHTAGENQWLK